MSNLKKLKQPLALFMAVFLLFGLYPLEPVQILSGEPHLIEETPEIDETDVDLLEEVKIEEELEDSNESDIKVDELEESSESEERFLVENEIYELYTNEDEEQFDNQEIDQPVAQTLELLPPSIYKSSEAFKGEIIQVGQYITYMLTVVNPNDVALYDHLVVDDLAGGALVNPRNVSVVPDFISFIYDIIAGELHIVLDYLPANGFADIRFEVRIADGVDAEEVVNTARLYGPVDKIGRPPIDEDSETVIVVRPETPSCPPCPPLLTCPPEEECPTQPPTAPSSSGTSSQSTSPTQPSTPSQSTTPTESSEPSQPGAPGQPGATGQPNAWTQLGVPTISQPSELTTQPSAPLPPGQPNMPTSGVVNPNELTQGVTTLPQTGVVVGSLFLSGLVLAASGLSIALKKKKN